MFGAKSKHEPKPCNNPNHVGKPAVAFGGGWCRDCIRAKYGDDHHEEVAHGGGSYHAR